jgi:hypothetical protein
MQPFRPACVLLLLAAALPLHAQVDPLKSPACGAAIASLQAAREGRADAAQVENLRSQAASTCLGMGSPPPRPSRAIQAPITVPPPQIDVPVAAPSIPGLPALSGPPPPVAVERLPVPATCDGNGCWVNDGTHMRQVPPNLMGPNGMCAQQGGQVYCR